ncbi:unnamed protein product [Ectocarpus sp. 4 AP-2014]
MQFLASQIDVGSADCHSKSCTLTRVPNSAFFVITLASACTRVTSLQYLVFLCSYAECHHTCCVSTHKLLSFPFVLSPWYSLVLLFARFDALSRRSLFLFLVFPGKQRHPFPRHGDWR